MENRIEWHRLWRWLQTVQHTIKSRIQKFRPKQIDDYNKKNLAGYINTAFLHSLACVFFFSLLYPDWVLLIQVNYISFVWLSAILLFHTFCFFMFSLNTFVSLEKHSHLGRQRKRIDNYLSKIMRLHFTKMFVGIYLSIHTHKFFIFKNSISWHGLVCYFHSFFCTTHHTIVHSHWWIRM